MSGRPKQRSRKYRARRLVNSERFWDLIFDLIRNGQNLPAISKALDVPYRTLWGWINESEENRQRYDEAKKRAGCNDQVKDFGLRSDKPL